MPINVNDPEYLKAELEYSDTKNPEEKLSALNKMISHAPKHKGGENLRQQLTQRRKKLEGEIEKKKKKGKSGKQGIKKGEMQAVIIGKTNSGKSSLLKKLTNSDPKISPVQFTTKEPTVGIMNYKDSPIQIIEIPAIEGENFERGVVHTADTLVILIKNFEELLEITKKIPPHQGKEIVVVTKSDLLTPEEKRKLFAKMQSKKYNFEIISTLPSLHEDNIEELKKKIFDSFDVLRIFTKEPGKNPEKRPMILKPNSNVRDVAEKILKGLSKKIVETKIWGPSSKFGGQVVGLNHKIKDLDTIEFKTR
ncbi:MAG: 50S ribosome-binding GTPase [Nanoarchaeota archaeon]|nr:50S ribosome-binding GTPase [Nanoarchaeota archaeon]